MDGINLVNNNKEDAQVFKAQHMHFQYKEVIS
jgi:hypothetical protein